MKSMFLLQKKFIAISMTLWVFATITNVSLFAQVAPLIFPNGGVHIDGNLESNIPASGIGDWVEGSAGSGGFIFNNNGTAVNPLKSKLIIDAYNGNDYIYQGSKFNDNPASWSWTFGMASGKNDINNVMYHLSTDAMGNSWVILGSDRFSNNGTSYIDFEFLQETVTRNPAGGFLTDGNDGGRTVNDLVISMEYNNGGSIGNVRFYLWRPVGSGFNYVEQTIPANVAFAVTNSVNTNVPFGAFGQQTYEPFQFVEAAVNISDLFGAIDPCLGISVKTIIIKTKASTSPTANLGDFVEPIQVAINFGTATISYENSNSMCPLGTATVDINGEQGGTFSSFPAGLSINSATGEINLSASSPGTYTITYSFTTNSCLKTTTTQVTILEAPIAPVFATSDQLLLCSDYNGNITLSSSGGSGSILNWYSDACSATFIGTGNNLTIPAPTQTTVYYAAWENACGISTCAQVTVDVLPPLFASGSISADISAFNANDGEITISVSGGAGNYTYSLNGNTPQASPVFSNLGWDNIILLFLIVMDVLLLLH
jgi:large repetitive protein